MTRSQLNNCDDGRPNDFCLMIFFCICIIKYLSSVFNCNSILNQIISAEISCCYDYYSIASPKLNTQQFRRLWLSTHQDIFTTSREKLASTRPTLFCCAPFRCVTHGRFLGFKFKLRRFLVPNLRSPAFLWDLHYYEHCVGIRSCHSKVKVLKGMFLF